jgi:hypothetical protein
MTTHYAPWSPVDRLGLPDLVLAELDAGRRTLIFTPRANHRSILDDLLAVVPPEGTTVHRSAGRERIDCGRGWVAFAATTDAARGRTIDTLITTDTSAGVVAALTPCLAQSREPRRLVLLP